MLQNKFEMPLDLAINPSKIFYSYFVVVVFLALTSILILTTVPVSSRILLILLLLFMTVFILLQLQSNQVTHLWLSDNSEWELEVNNEKYFSVELKGECIVTYFLIWLNFSVINTEKRSQTFHVLLLPDSSDKDLLRQLRVRLRFLLKVNKDKLEIVE